MSTTNPGSGLTAAGLALVLLAVSAGVGSSDLGLLVGFVWVMAGATLIFAGVARMEPTTPTFSPAPHARLGGVPRRHLALAGLVLSSSAATAVAGGEAAPVPCFAMFALFLFGISLIYIHFSEVGLLLGLAGVLLGANLIPVGVQVGGDGEEPGTPISRAVWAFWDALTAFLLRNTDAVGLILSSTAIVAVAGGEAGPGLAFAMFALFLLGLYLIINNTPVLGEEE